jgi:hypothetical protein
MCIGYIQILHVPFHNKELKHLKILVYEEEGGVLEPILQIPKDNCSHQLPQFIYTL